MLSADYVGFGAAKGLEHPYLTAAPSAAVVLDLLHAGQTWRQQQAVADNGQLFLAGYSEGGYVTLATQRAIETTGDALRQQLQASVPGAGPYDVQATLDAQVEAVRAYNTELGKIKGSAINKATGNPFKPRAYFAAAADAQAAPKVSF